MSISPLSAISTLLSSAQAPQSSRRQDFAQLASALQSGNLAGAQQAYGALQQGQGASGGSSTSINNSVNNPITTDFAALGKALSSGDLNGAQSAFSQLQSDLKSAQGTQQGPAQTTAGTKGHHHHHHGGEGGGEGEPSSTTSTPSATATNSAGNTPARGSVNLLG